MKTCYSVGFSSAAELVGSLKQGVRQPSAWAAVVWPWNQFSACLVCRALAAVASAALQSLKYLGFACSFLASGAHTYNVQVWHIPLGFQSRAATMAADEPHPPCPPPGKVVARNRSYLESYLPRCQL